MDFDTTKEAMEHNDTSKKYEKQYLQRIANGCSIDHTPSSPGSGDCGYHLLGYVVAKSPSLVTELNKLRKIINDKPLEFCEKLGNNESFHDTDITFCMRSLYSQCAIYQKSVMNNFFSKQTFDLELKDICDKDGNVDWEYKDKHNHWGFMPKATNTKKKVASY